MKNELVSKFSGGSTPYGREGRSPHVHDQKNPTTERETLTVEKTEVKDNSPAEDNSEVQVVQPSNQKPVDTSPESSPKGKFFGVTPY